MKFAICNETYVDWAFERVCDDVAACGFDGIEIAPMTLHPDPGSLTEADAAGYRETARRAGLEVVGLHWLLKAPEGLHLTTPDATVRLRTVRHLQHLVRLCAAMGGRVMVLGSPQQRDVVSGDRYEDAFARAAEGCREVAELAGELGVLLALEPLAPAYTSFLRTAAEAISLIEAVDHSACRLHLDAFAMSSEERPAAAIIEAYEAHLVHFHANDTSLRGPGTGTIDFASIAGALQRVRYDGYVSVEVFDFSEGGPKIARDSIEFMREVFA